MGIFVAAEIDFPVDIIKAVMRPTEEEMYSSEIYHTYYSKQNNTLSQFCENSRVIKHNSEMPKRISGIVEAFNRSDKLILFYNQIQYSTGLDLAMTLGTAYNKPILIINGNGKMELIHNKEKKNYTISEFYNLKSSCKKVVNSELINYTLSDITNKNYDLTNAKNKLSNHYDKLKQYKISRQIIVLE